MIKMTFFNEHTQDWQTCDFTPQTFRDMNQFAAKHGGISHCTIISN